MCAVEEAAVMVNAMRLQLWLDTGDTHVSMQTQTAKMLSPCWRQCGSHDAIHAGHELGVRELVVREIGVREHVQVISRVSKQADGGKLITLCLWACLYTERSSGVGRIRPPEVSLGLSCTQITATQSVDSVRWMLQPLMACFVGTQH